MIKKLLTLSLISLSLIGATASAKVVLSEKQIEKAKAIELYESDYPSEEELTKAIIIFEKYSAEDPKMLYYFGLANRDAKTKYLKLNKLKGSLYIEQAAVLGDEDAQYEYAMKLLKEEDFSAGLEYLKKSATEGQRKSQHQLGRMFYQGNGVPLNKTQGFQLIKTSAESNYPEAQYDLAKIYFSQKQIELQKAGIYWLKRAVKNNEFKACDELYKIYKAGIIVDTNIKEHVKYLSCSAQNDNVDAMLLLANYYETGKYIAKDVQASAYWYKKLANLRVAEGAYKYTKFLIEESKNKNNSATLKESISELSMYSREHVETAMLLGNIYKYGMFGLRKSKSMAIQHFENAKQLGNQNAQNEILSLLSSD